MSARALLYVLDSDTVSFHQRGSPAVIARFAAVTPESIATTAITLEEQIQGRLARVRRPTNPTELIATYWRLSATQAYFCTIPILPFDALAAELYRELQSRRIRVGTNDLRIAAIALSRSAVLVTSNRRHFEQIDGLVLEDWHGE